MILRPAKILKTCIWYNTINLKIPFLGRFARKFHCDLEQNWHSWYYELLRNTIENWKFHRAKIFIPRKNLENILNAKYLS